MVAMSHQEWVKTVNEARGYYEYFHGSSPESRIYWRVLMSRPVSVMGRTVGFWIWKAGGWS